MSAEMEKLDKEEKCLERQEKSVATNHELASNRQKVADLKGTITGDTSKSENNKHGLSMETGDISKSSRKSKSKTDSKRPEEFNINSLRRDEHLQTLVRKELKKICLADKCGESNDTEVTVHYHLHHLQ